jgi:uncharacterized small protein (TIGR04563 family)
MAGNDKQKQSLYFPEDMLAEIMREANRLDRSLSWMVQHAWRIARDEVKRFPSVDVRAPVPLEPRAAARADEPGAQVREFLKGKFEKEASS